MNMAYLMIPVALLAVSLLISFILVKKGKPAKKVMRVHFLTLILIVAATCAVPFMASAAANEPTAAEEAAAAVTSVGDGMKYLAAALARGSGRYRRRYRRRLRCPRRYRRYGGGSQGVR